MRLRGPSRRIIRADHIALYALFSITLCRHALMARVPLHIIKYGDVYDALAVRWPLVVRRGTPGTSSDDWTVARWEPAVWLSSISRGIRPHNYFVPGMGAKYCDQGVCVSVCLSVCSFAYLKNHTSKFHQIFCACYRWPRLRPSLTTMRYVMYVRFVNYETP